MGLKLAEQLKLDNTAVQRRRNWTLAHKGGGGCKLFFLLLAEFSFFFFFPFLSSSFILENFTIANSHITLEVCFLSYL